MHSSELAAKQHHRQRLGFGGLESMGSLQKKRCIEKGWVGSLFSFQSTNQPQINSWVTVPDEVAKVCGEQNLGNPSQLLNASAPQTLSRIHTNQSRYNLAVRYQDHQKTFFRSEFSGAHLASIRRGFAHRKNDSQQAALLWNHTQGFSQFSDSDLGNKKQNDGDFFSFKKKIVGERENPAECNLDQLQHHYKKTRHHDTTDTSMKVLPVHKETGPRSFQFG